MLAPKKYLILQTPKKDPARFAIVTQILDETCKDWGSEISITKTKWRYVSPTLNVDRELPDLFIRAVKVERVHDFLYPGSLVGDSYSLGSFEHVQ